MKAVFVVLFAVGVSGYGVNHGGAVRKCSGGVNCPGSVPHGGTNGGSPVPANANRRVATVNSGGGYWWQNNNPFVNAGQRAPSKAGAKPLATKPGSSSVSVHKKPSVGSRPVSGATRFPGTSSITSNLPLGGPSAVPGNQGFNQPPIGNAMINPMGICPVDFVCVHWQLCRNGQVILDGTGRIDKSKRKPVRLTEKSCGGDMICCGVTPGYTVPGVISSLTSEQTGGGFIGGAGASSHTSSTGSLSSFGPGTGSNPSGAGSNPFVNKPGKPLQGGSHTTGSFKPQSPGVQSPSQSGCGNSVFGNCNNLPNSGSQPSNNLNNPGSYNPSSSSSGSGFNQPTGSGVSSGSYNPQSSAPGSNSKPFAGTSGPGGFGQHSTGGSSISSGNFNPSGSSSIGTTNQFDVPSSGSYNPAGTPTGSQPLGGLSPPIGGGFPSVGTNKPLGSKPSSGKFPQQPSGGSSSSGYNPSVSAPSGGSRVPGGGSLATGAFGPTGSLSGSSNQPVVGGSSGSYSPSASGGHSTSTGSSPGGVFTQHSNAGVPSGSHFNPAISSSGSSSPSASGSYNPSGSSPGGLSQNFPNQGPSGSPSPGALNFPGSLPSQGSRNPVIPGAGSQGSQSGMPSMSTMMAGMMGMNGNPLVAGTCSAGTYCVPNFQCNPYDGFIITNPNALRAVWPDSPQVPLLRCLIPAGVLNDGVCCQQNHPIIGPNGQPVD